MRGIRGSLGLLLGRLLLPTRRALVLISSALGWRRLRHKVTSGLELDWSIAATRRVEVVLGRRGARVCGGWAGRLHDGALLAKPGRPMWRPGGAPEARGQPPDHTILCSVNALLLYVLVLGPVL